MKFKRFLALLITIVLASALLASCVNIQVSTSTTAYSTTTDITSTAKRTLATPGDGSLLIISDKFSDYTLIRSDRSNKVITDSMLELHDAITANYGVTLELKTDWVKGVYAADTYETDEKEILIGQTNRKESKQVMESLNKNEYAVRVVGNKLVIAGNGDNATITAVKQFIKEYLNKGSELKIPANYTLSGDAGVQQIPLAQGADIRVMTFNIFLSGNDYPTRKGYTVSAILDHLPDVIGFQEVNKEAFNGTIRNAAIDEYYGINAETHSGKSTVNYTPILYLKDKYTLVEGGVEWQNSRYEKTNTKSQSWAVLENKETGQRFIIVNYHGSLWADTYELPSGETHASMKEKAVEWRNDNARQMLEKIASLREKYGDLPAVSTGDFNFTKTAEAYSIILNGPLASAQEKATGGASKGVKSHHTLGQYPGTGDNIDHIFFSETGFEAIKFVISVRADDLKASDHCPVYADLKFK